MTANNRSTFLIMLTALIIGGYFLVTQIISAITTVTSALEKGFQP